MSKYERLLRATYNLDIRKVTANTNSGCHCSLTAAQEKKKSTTKTWIMTDKR